MPVLRYTVSCIAYFVMSYILPDYPNNWPPQIDYFCPSGQ